MIYETTGLVHEFALSKSESVMVAWREHLPHLCVDRCVNGLATDKSDRTETLTTGENQ